MTTLVLIVGFFVPLFMAVRSKTNGWREATDSIFPAACVRSLDTGKKPGKHLVGLRTEGRQRLSIFRRMWPLRIAEYLGYPPRDRVFSLGRRSFQLVPEMPKLTSSQEEAVVTILGDIHTAGGGGVAIEGGRISCSVSRPQSADSRGDDWFRGRLSDILKIFAEAGESSDIAEKAARQWRLVFGGLSCLIVFGLFGWWPLLQDGYETDAFEKLLFLGCACGMMVAAACSVAIYLWFARTPRQSLAINAIPFISLALIPATIYAVREWNIEFDRSAPILSSQAVGLKRCTVTCRKLEGGETSWWIVGDDCTAETRRSIARNSLAIDRCIDTRIDLRLGLGREGLVDRSDRVRDVDAGMFDGLHIGSVVPVFHRRGALGIEWHDKRGVSIASGSANNF